MNPIPRSRGIRLQKAKTRATAESNWVRDTLITPPPPITRTGVFITVFSRGFVQYHIYFHEQ